MTSVSSQAEVAGPPKTVTEVQNTTMVENEATTSSIASTTVSDIGVHNEISTDVATYLTRPKFLYSISSSTISNPVLYDVLYDFLTKASIKRKWWNYHLLRATINVKFSVVANPYVYGIAVAAPYYNDNNTQRTLTANNAQYKLLQRDHVLIDPSNPGPCTLSIPYSDSVPYWDLHKIAGGTSVNHPKVTMAALTTFISALTAAATPIVIHVTVWLSDIDLGIPVPIDFQSEVQQAGKGFISGPATIVANAAGVLKKIPVIAPFASAVEIGSNAVAGIAKIFGFSKPRDPDVHTTVGFTPQATYLQADQFRPLTLDPGQGVSMSPDLNADTEDPLLFKNILGHEGLVFIGSYNTTATVGTSIMQIPVHPGAYYATSDNSVVHMTPLAFGSLLFRYWRGSIKYRITIVASKYHRGRLRAWWSPFVDTPTDSSDITNNAFNVAFDVSCTTVIEITVTWGSQYPYMRVSLQPTGITTSYNAGVANGYLNLQVAEPLNAPSAANVLFYVTAMAADDFELVRPTLTAVNKLSRMAHQELEGVPEYDELDLYEPDGQEINQVGNVSLPVWVEPQSSSTGDTEVAQLSLIRATLGHSQYVDNANKAFMGERFTSFRPLIKRASPSFYYPGEGGATVYSVPWCPPEPGVYSAPSGNLVNYGQTWTYVGYLRMAFRMDRGGMRVQLLPTTDYTVDPAATVTTSTDRPFGYKLLNGVDHVVINSANSVSVGDAREVFNLRYQTLSYQIPWQFPCLGKYTYKPQTRVSNTWIEPSSRVAMTNQGYLIGFSYAAGEDYTVSTFIGPPNMAVYGPGVYVEPEEAPLEGDSVPPLDSDTEA